MTDFVVETLILDLLEWLANGDRTYEQVMDAWRTSCPRFPVWEDANDRGFIKSVHLDGCTVVRLTPSGRAHLDNHRRRDTQHSAALPPNPLNRNL